MWTIDELGAKVAAALDGATEPGNRQIRAVPDKRTIRYYTPLGLIDRPAAMKGRTALYDDKHLTQLVAINRLQARGLSLAEIQERLAGLPDKTLAEIAGVKAAPSKPKFETPRARHAFWAEETAERATPSPSTIEAQMLLSGIPLSDDVTLLLTPGREVDEADVEALRSAAAPLLRLLKERGLDRQRSTL